VLNRVYNISDIRVGVTSLDREGILIISPLVELYIERYSGREIRFEKTIDDD